MENKVDREAKKEAKTVNERTWNEFSDCGMLWYVNRILQVFGWSIVLVKVAGDFICATPIRTKHRGFTEKAEDEEYLKITKYMAENSKELLEEVME